MNAKHMVEQAQRVFEVEARAILDLKGRLGPSFENAIRCLLACRGKVIVTGMGKSGLIGRKIAATLSSTGTPSFFLHPAEGAHGDLGMITKDDVVISISYSGETPELSHLLNYLARKGISNIAMTGNLNSTLAKASNEVLDVGVREEACPLGLAPTASTTAILAMGDALSMALLDARGFKPEDFAEYHPGGTLGARLLTRVKDVMHSGEGLPLVRSEMGMKEAISIMTSREVRGVVGVVDDRGDLVGIVTDGDLRRRLDRSENPLQGTVKDLMSASPKTIDKDEMAEKALFVMEQFRIQVLFVVDMQSGALKKPIGLLHLQDLLKSKVR